MECAEYNSILEGLSDPAILLDLKLKPLYFNGAFIQMMGVRQRQLLNLLDEKNTIFRLMGLDSEEEINVCNRSIDNCESVHITEKILENPKGDTFTGMESYIPILSKDGTCQALIIHFRDESPEVRMQHRYEEMLQKEKKYSEKLAEIVDDRTKQLRKALEEVTLLSQIDSLTGLLNRREFMKRADHMLKMSKRHEFETALFMIDIDDFKNLNDTLGHQAGDTILKEVGQTILHTFREVDFVGWYGGEEFIVLLGYSNIQRAPDIAARLLGNIKSLSWEENVPEKKDPVTISLGISFYKIHGEELDSLIAAADKALYEAKKSGKDRYIIYNPG